MAGYGHIAIARSPASTTAAMFTLELEPWFL
jgi:hypothetical protein